jgi:hypothetical protein
MKKVVIKFCFVFLFANCEKPSDCIKSSGQMTSKVYEGIIFTKIIVNKRIGLVITQGNDYKVEVKTGENLINDIEVNVIDNKLILEDNTTCNWVRDYGETTVYVTTPHLTDVYCKTEKDITCNGVLSFPYLHLVSMNNYDGYSGSGTGDYILNLACEKLLIENNDVSRYFLTGEVKEMTINFYEFGGIFYGQNLSVDSVSLYHRGTNDMFIRPIHSIKGDIYNVGNVICNSKPEKIEVNQHYKGKLIFN